MRDAGLHLTRRGTIAAAAALLLSPRSAAAASGNTAANPAIDHIMIGVADLDTAIARVAKATGVTPAIIKRGGQGETLVAMASLGGRRFLEFIGANPDAAEAARGDFWKLLRSLPDPTPIGVGLAAPGGMAATVAKAAAAGIPGKPEPGSGTIPGGGRVAWTGFDLTPELTGGLFLIAWNAGLHPSEVSPKGLRLDRLDITLPPADRLGKYLAALGIAIPVAAGPARIVATVTGPEGSMILG